MTDDSLPQSENGRGVPPGGRSNRIGSGDLDDGQIIAGTVVENLPSGTYKVKLDYGGQILAHLSGKIRKNIAKIQYGDRVNVELMTGNPALGRITSLRRT